VLLANGVLVEDVSELVARLDEIAAREIRARAPARVERVERETDVDVAVLAVARVRVRDATAPPGAEELRVLVGRVQGRAVDIAVPAQRDELSSSEDVLVLDFGAEAACRPCG
jgi:hypothetical protein